MRIINLPILLCAPAAAILVPGPAGPYSVAMSVHSLTDHSRYDNLKPDDGQDLRRVLVSIFLPVGKGSCDIYPVEAVPYMTPSVAAAYGELVAGTGLPRDIFSEFELTVSNISEPTPAALRMGNGNFHSTLHRYPVALFTPGLGRSRLLYGARARSLASQGVVVVTVDHPYDADIVEFPDGSVIRGANISEDDPAALSNAVQVRSKDLSFVIDQLANKTTLSQLVPDYADRLDLDRIAVYGHSLGGAAAAAVARADKRARGGLNFDGRVVDPIKTSGLGKPFILAGREDHSQTDESWSELYPNLCGPRAEVSFANTTHGSFQDLPTLLSALDIPGELKPVLDQLLGSAEPEALDEAINAVLMGFLDLSFRGKAEWLEKGVEDSPLTSFARKDLKRGGKTCRRTGACRMR